VDSKSFAKLINKYSSVVSLEEHLLNGGCVQLPGLQEKKILNLCEILNNV